MKTLVTGALGFVGLNITRELALRGFEVLALARREPDAEAQQFLAEVAARISWLKGDVTERSSLVDLVRTKNVSHILHAAALTASPEEEKANPVRMFEVNAGGTLNVLEAARQAHVKRVVFVSSSGIYGAASPTPLKKETDPLHISGLYAICKQTSEQLCLRYQELYGLSVAVGRLGTAYGPMERATQSRQGMSAIYRAVQLALRQPSVKVRGAHIARDFCHIDDVAEAFALLLRAEKLNYPIYNVAALQAYPLSDALETLRETIGLDWQEVETAQEADLIQTAVNARAGLDTSRLQGDTKWQSNYDLASGTAHYLAYLGREA
jgi:UDP-glucuronate 4-epimerase